MSPDSQVVSAARRLHLAITSNAIALIGLVVITAVLTLLMTSRVTDVAPLIVGPALFIISLPILRGIARRDGDPKIGRLLVIGLALKLAMAIVRHYVAFSVYGAADATGYFNHGVALASQFRQGNFTTSLPSLTGTDFMDFLSGLVYTFIPPSRISGFLFFSWLSFWGQVFFYKAFRIAVPEGRSRSYAYWVLFLPSILYWPSGIGKEAWMIPTLGLACLGAALALNGSTLKGFLTLGAGLWLAAMVRPHMAALVAIPFVVAYLLRPVSKRLHQLAPLAKVLSLVVVLVLAVLFVRKTQSFLGSNRGFSSVADYTTTQKGIASQSDNGGSAFHPVIVTSPIQLPQATLNVMFRPLATEAHNAQALLAAAESTFILLFSLYRIRWLFAALKSGRRQPYVILAFLYIGLFVVAYSSFPNFGLLARERVQALPLYFVLFCVPPAKERLRKHREKKQAQAEPVPS